MTGRRQDILPIRTCLGCRTRKPQRELWRLAVDGQGRVFWDPERTAPGRGAYVCGSPECLKAALGRGRLARAFRKPVGTERLEDTKPPWAR
ncbi:MAG: YlxR family protein [Thermodesulfobacteriota bacterium]